MFPTGESETSTVGPVVDSELVVTEILRAPIESTTPTPTVDYTTSTPTLPATETTVQTFAPTLPPYNPFLTQELKHEVKKVDAKLDALSSPLPPPTVLPYSETIPFTLFTTNGNQPQPTRPIR